MRSVLVFWTAQAKLALCTKNIVVQIRDPLPPARCDIEEADRILDMRRYAAPIELRILIGKIGWRSITELLVHPNLFKFVIKRIGFAKIMWVAQLTDKVGSADQHSLLAVDIASAGRCRKSSKLDSICNAGGVERLDLSETLHHEKL